MDKARLQELEAQIAHQQTVLVERQQALRQQQERVDALMRELEQLRALLADNRARDEQTELPL